jgi:hypothetical protein
MGSGPPLLELLDPSPVLPSDELAASVSSGPLLVEVATSAVVVPSVPLSGAGEGMPVVHPASKIKKPSPRSTSNRS